VSVLLQVLRTEIGTEQKSLAVQRFCLVTELLAPSRWAAWEVCSSEGFPDAALGEAGAGTRTGVGESAGRNAREMGEEGAAAALGPNARSKRASPRR
jgi:hypothetical protein